MHRSEGNHLLFLLPIDSVGQAQVANRVFDHRAVLLQSRVCERHQVLERLESEFTHRVLVVVVVILDHMLCVQLDILELLEGLPVVLVDVMGASRHLLEPHRLIVMDADIVAAILHKDVHDVDALLNVAFFQGVHG